MKNRGRDRRFYAAEDAPRRTKAIVLAFITLLCGVYYLYWLTLTLNTEHPILAVLFFAAEAFCFLLFAVATADLWRLRFKPPGGLRAEVDYSIDILITACGEPPAVVAKTLHGVSRIRWSGPLRVYVLDDGACEEVRRICIQKGFHYFSRRLEGIPQDNAKSGNLNFGLQRTDGELLLVLDADQVPKPEILEVMAGYMKFPDLAFIQSRQSYLVPREDPFFNLDEVFHGGFQLAMDDRNGVISCGSGVLYRRAALQDIGGFATWNLVEDLTTSYELHSRGWKSFYHPYPLSIGLAPDSVCKVYRQRGQWALDTMRLFWYDNPLFKKGLDWPRKLNYLTIGLSYLCSGFVFPLFFIIPLWSYLTGNNILTCPEWEFVLTRIFYFFSMAAALHYLFKDKRPGKQFQMLTGLFPVYIWNTVRALFYPPGRKPAYSANNTRKRRKCRPTGILLMPQLILFWGNAILPFVALIFETAPPRMIAANACVSVVALWSLWQVLEAGFSSNDWDLEMEPRSFYGLDTQTSC
jgi:cellulose synthase (UDP-forming)